MRGAASIVGAKKASPARDLSFVVEGEAAVDVVHDRCTEKCISRNPIHFGRASPDLDSIELHLHFGSAAGDDIPHAADFFIFEARENGIFIDCLRGGAAPRGAV
jgi:hypothetical protein